MAFIAKIDPVETIAGQNIRIDERAMYNGKSISSGDRIFIWTSETAGGRGLVAVGSVISPPAITGSRVLAEVLVEATVLRQLGLSEIAAYGDAEAGSPESDLARIIYRQSHNKIAALNEISTEFLEEYFT